MKKYLIIITYVIILSCGSTLSLKDKLISEHPEWSTVQIEKIRKGEIDLGMTEDMVKASWGKPRYIHQTDSEYSGKVTAWSYIKLYSGDIKTVSFKDGKVTMYSNGSTK